MKNYKLLKLGVATFAVAALGVAEVAQAEEVNPSNPLTTASTEPGKTAETVTEAPAAEVVSTPATNVVAETPKAEEAAPVATPVETPVANEATNEAVSEAAVETPAATTTETPAANAETSSETPATDTTETRSASEATAETPKAETPASSEAFNGTTYEPFVNPVGESIGDPNQKIEGYTPIRLTYYFDKSLGEQEPLNFYVFINKNGEFTQESREYFIFKGAIPFWIAYKQFEGYSVFDTDNIFKKITYDMVEKGQTVFNTYWSNPAGYVFKNEDGSVSVKTSTSDDTFHIHDIEAKVVTAETVLSKLPASAPAKNVLLYDIKLNSYDDNVKKGIITGEATVTAKVDPTRKVEKVFYFLPETGAIEELPFTLSEDGSSVIFKVTHFSNYGVLYADADKAKENAGKAEDSRQPLHYDYIEYEVQNEKVGEHTNVKYVELKKETRTIKPGETVTLTAPSREGYHVVRGNKIEINYEVVNNYRYLLPNREGEFGVAFYYVKDGENTVLNPYQTTYDETKAKELEQAVREFRTALQDLLKLDSSKYTEESFKKEYSATIDGVELSDSLATLMLYENFRPESSEHSLTENTALALEHYDYLIAFNKVEKAIVDQIRAGLVLKEQPVQPTDEVESKKFFITSVGIDSNSEYVYDVSTTMGQYVEVTPDNPYTINQPDATGWEKGPIYVKYLYEDGYATMNNGDQITYNDLNTYSYVNYTYTRPADPTPQPTDPVTPVQPTEPVTPTPSTQDKGFAIFYRDEEGKQIESSELASDAIVSTSTPYVVQHPSIAGYTASGAELFAKGVAKAVNDGDAVTYGDLGEKNASVMYEGVLTYKYTRNVQPTQPSEEPKKEEPTTPSEQPKEEPAKPSEEKPADKPAETPKPAEQPKSEEKPADKQKPADQSKPADGKDTTKPSTDKQNSDVKTPENKGGESSQDQAKKPVSKLNADKADKPSSTSPAPKAADKPTNKAEKASESKASLPNTGENSSLLAFAGMLLASLGLAGLTYKGRHDR